MVNVSMAGQGSHTVRMQAMLAMSWILGGVVAGAVGISLLGAGGLVRVVVGVLVLGAATVAVVGTARVRLRVSGSELEIRNHLRTYRLSPSAVTAVRFGTAMTPLTWARGWPVLVLHTESGDLIRAIATAGMDPGAALAIVSSIRRSNSAVTVEERLIERF